MFAIVRLRLRERRIEPLIRKLSSDREVRIGDVRCSFPAIDSPELVPSGYLSSQTKSSQSILGHLRWLLQKDRLGQDMMLLGSPGQFRRQLAFQYAELTQRPVEYVAVSRDTTESDLKQRREITGGTARFVDQAPVRAALHGRLLIIDGLEKAERNVLPTLNNLLENREMQLDDGRFLMDAKRFDELQASGALAADTHIIRAHPSFRVLALGLPVPPFKGKPLDPPLRSRFQVRVCHPPMAGDMWEALVAAASQVDSSVSSVPADNPRLMRLCQVMSSLRALEETWRVESTAESHQVVGMPHFPEGMMTTLARLVQAFPEDKVETFAARSFPFFGSIPLGRDQEPFVKASKLVLDQLGEDVEKNELPMASHYVVSEIKEEREGRGMFVFQSKEQIRQVSGAVGPMFKGFPMKETCHPSGRAFYSIDKHVALLSGMVQDHCVDRDILLLGEAGSGKSRLAEEFARILGYETVLFSLYKDMSARDLLQRRTTDSKGNTGWDDSPLISAAIHGDLLILDGIDRVESDTLTVIQRLISDREIELLDGRRLKRNGELQVHPRFRVIALGTTSAGKPHGSWLTSELISMFSTHYLEKLLPAEQEMVIRACFPRVPSEFLDTLRQFSNGLVEVRQMGGKRKQQGKDGAAELTKAASLGLKPLSTRQVMRLCRFANAFPDRAMEEMRERVRNIVLGHFLPVSQRKGLEELMDQVGIPADEHTVSAASQGSRKDGGEEIDIVVEQGKVRIGQVVAQVESPQHPELVPAPLFYDIPKHKEVLRDLVEDIVSEEKYILLIGNQGVGKNKLADRLLQLLQREREYVQLHRDSTVGTLTLSPSLRDGVVVWDDSPLVRAAIHGRTLMVDEIDKAPLEVVSVLKSLIEDEEMLLADGRRLVSQARFEAAKGFGRRTDNLIPIHPKFSIFALANRPGWPFQGNSFFAEIGDIFSSHVISNPDLHSELELLKSYAPNVDVQILEKLVRAFADLRQLVAEGVLVYPYSARECVAVAKHLEVFPGDGLVKTLENVLGFDSYDAQLMDVIVGVFQKHGIPLTRAGSGSPRTLTIAVAESKPLAPPVATESWSNE